jgi:transposase
MNAKDDIRIKQFRQLKKEIRGSSEYLVVGIDVAKDKHNAFFGTATGKALFRRLVFENNIEGGTFVLKLPKVHLDTLCTNVPLYIGIIKKC